MYLIPCKELTQDLKNWDYQINRSSWIFNFVVFNVPYVFAYINLDIRPEFLVLYKNLKLSFNIPK